MSLEYRKNVAAIILNDQGELLVCKRSDQYKAWQLPQGGIEENELAEEAIIREIEEELGTTKPAKILAKLPTTICYDWPPTEHHRGHKGQEQTYFLMHLAEGETIDLHSAATKEFEDYKWVGINEFLNLISGFKAEAYKQAISEFKKIFPNLIKE
jgi:putative (di)nucleoside polyphosphate hydrolase